MASALKFFVVGSSVLVGILLHGVVSAQDDLADTKATMSVQSCGALNLETDGQSSCQTENVWKPITGRQGVAITTHSLNKKVLDQEAYDRWGRIVSPMLSNDGRWVVYTTESAAGIGELIVRSTRAAIEYRADHGTIPRAQRCGSSSDEPESRVLQRPAAKRQGVLPANYQGEGHALRGHVNQLDWDRRVNEFLDHCLSDAPRPAWMDAQTYADTP